ncbi:MAG: 3-dehydroquinate dehydratase [Pseudoxanthomonas sp.]
MSIVILRGPEQPASQQSQQMPALPPQVLRALVDRAIAAGTTLAIRSCATESELLNAVRINQQHGAELTLLDPGTCSGSLRLQRTLQACGMRYIEVHDDHPGALEASLPDQHGQRLALAQGYGAQSYTLALSMALEHLGCEEGDAQRVGI